MEWDFESYLRRLFLLHCKFNVCILPIFLLLSVSILSFPLAVKSLSPLCFCYLWASDLEIMLTPPWTVPSSFCPDLCYWDSSCCPRVRNLPAWKQGPLWPVPVHPSPAFPCHCLPLLSTPAQMLGTGHGCQTDSHVPHLTGAPVLPTWNDLVQR